MPLGNLTSQFFANVYLNELDQFVKHKLKAKYYIRYVDDFVILHYNIRLLQHYKHKIKKFLKNKLNLELHPNKSRILQIHKGISFLGFRNFYYHKFLKKKNIRKFKRKLSFYNRLYDKGIIDYDKIYDFLEGWVAYAKHADTGKLRIKILKEIENRYVTEISIKEINRLST